MTVPSFSHIADHPHIRAVERQLAANPEFANFGPDWNQTIDLMQSVAEKSHREAAMIMHEFEVTNGRSVSTCAASNRNPTTTSAPTSFPIEMGAQSPRRTAAQPTSRRRSRRHSPVVSRCSR